MPYSIREVDGKYCVYKEDEQLKCYDDKGEAQDYLAALEANVDDASKQVMRPTQAEAGYETLSSHPGQACANCRFFASMGEHGEPLPYCHLIENYPLDILPTGYCSRFEERPSMEVEPMPVPVVVIEEQGMMQVDDKAGRMISAANAGVLKKAWESAKAGFETLTDMLSKAGLFETDDEEKTLKEVGSSFVVFKGSDGKHYWKATWSNDFKDRDEEIIESVAHIAYLERVNTGLVPLPDLYYWHMPEFKHGKALHIERVGHMMVAFGEFDDTPLAKAFIRHYQKNKKKVSHGFKYPVWAKKGGNYASYNTFEISPLPPDVAANLYTDFEEITMTTLSDERKSHMISVLGEDLFNQTIAKTAELSKALEGAGIAFKDFADISDATALASEGGEGLLGKMLLALVESQGALVAKQDTDNKAFSEKVAALEAANKTLEEKNKSLEDRLAHTPRSASQSDKTVVSDPNLLNQVQDKATEYDDWFKQFGADFNVPKKNGVT